MKVNKSIEDERALNSTAVKMKKKSKAAAQGAYSS